DAVGVAVGPAGEDGIGLFDVVHTDRSLTGEPTGVSHATPRPEQRRTQILAWIASQPAPEVDPAAVAEPCAALKRLVADEPLDPIPALDGGPRRPAIAPAPPPPKPVEPSPEETVPRLEPEREDTATAVEVPDVSRTVTVPGRRISRILVIGAALAMGATALVLWRAFS
ncbi:MAG: hypothetical protein ACOZNI_31860, partial [Myxococcota bacterium]